MAALAPVAGRRRASMASPAGSLASPGPGGDLKIHCRCQRLSRSRLRWHGIPIPQQFTFIIGPIGPGPGCQIKRKAVVMENTIRSQPSIAGSSEHGTGGEPKGLPDKKHEIANDHDHHHAHSSSEHDHNARKDSTKAADSSEEILKRHVNWPVILASLQVNKRKYLAV